MVLETNTPLNEFLNVSLKIDTSSANSAILFGVANGGYWGIPCEAKSNVRLSFLRQGGRRLPPEL